MGDLDLARRFTQAPRWRWRPGTRRLRWAPGFRDHLKPQGRVPDGRDDWDYDADTVVPDLYDPATYGCIVALVRDAWGGFVWVRAQLTRDGFRFYVAGLHVSDEQRVNGTSGHPTEAAAWLAALEAAP